MFQIRLRFFTLFYHFESILGGIKTRLKCFRYTGCCLIIIKIHRQKKESIRKRIEGSIQQNVIWAFVTKAGWPFSFFIFIQQQWLGLNARVWYLPLLWPVRPTGAAVKRNDVILTNLMTSYWLLNIFLNLSRLDDYSKLEDLSTLILDLHKIRMMM